MATMVIRQHRRCPTAILIPRDAPPCQSRLSLQRCSKVTQIYCYTSSSRAHTSIKISILPSKQYRPAAHVPRSAPPRSSCIAASSMPATRSKWSLSSTSRKSTGHEAQEDEAVVCATRPDGEIFTISVKTNATVSKCSRASRKDSTRHCTMFFRPSDTIATTRVARHARPV